METKHLVFVYGTLRKNEHNHYLLKEATCITEQAWTRGVMYATICYYPVLTNLQERTVYGELYEVNETQLDRLDQLEGYKENGNNNLYNRVKQTIHTDKGEYEAYVYVMDRRDPQFFQERIESADWKVYQLIKKPNFLYFAYGSCMDNKRFKEANVHHFFEQVIGRGVLDGYTIRFTRRAHDGGRADIVE
jgi:gamma-glutamylcyclotransferase (GGCT)/AIG2-like uncharacterized protein YtfP